MSNDILIEHNVANWTLPPTQGDLGGTYTGAFQFRTFLSPIQQLQAGREYRDYLGQHLHLANETEGNLAFALTQLKHRIIKAPPFWTSTLPESGLAGNIGDLNIIALVLDAAIRAENLFKERIAKEREELLNRSIEAGEKILHQDSEEE